MSLPPSPSPQGPGTPFAGLLEVVGHRETCCPPPIITVEMYSRTLSATFMITTLGMREPCPHPADCPIPLRGNMVRRGLGQTVLVGVAGGGGSTAHAEFDEDVAEMTRNGLLSQEQFGGDRPIRTAVPGGAPPSRAPSAGLPRCRARRGRWRRGRPSTQLLEGGTGSIDLHTSCVVAQRPASCADLKPRLGCLVRHVDSLPEGPTHVGDW